MVSRRTLDIFEAAAARWAAAEAEGLDNWSRLCGCPTPGEKLSCLSCPYFRELVQQIQQKLHPAPATVFAELLAPQILPPYPDEVKQECLKMYEAGYLLERIQRLTGVTNRKPLRAWIQKAGLHGIGIYPPELQQHCIDLYVKGLSPQQIEDQIHVDPHIISDWVYLAGKARPRQQFSDEQKQRCLTLYQEGCPLKNIENETGVHKELVRTWAKRAKVCRPKTYKHPGGSQPTTPPEVKESCRKLLKEGKTPPQIEELVGISADTIRQWKKEWDKYPNS